MFFVNCESVCLECFLYRFVRSSKRCNGQYISAYWCVWRSTICVHRHRRTSVHERTCRGPLPDAVSAINTPSTVLTDSLPLRPRAKIAKITYVQSILCVFVCSAVFLTKFEFGTHARLPRQCFVFISSFLSPGVYVLIST